MANVFGAFACSFSLMLLVVLVLELHCYTLGSRIHAHTDVLVFGLWHGRARVSPM